MSNPFNSSYIQTAVTAATPAEGVPKSELSQTAGNLQSSAEKLGQATYGFDPHKYVIGKPKRVIIRGKIASESSE